AQSWLRELENCKPLRADDAVAQLQALILMGENAAGWRLYRSYQDQPWHAGADRRLLELGAACAARLGRDGDALDLLEQALAENQASCCATEKLEDERGAAELGEGPSVFELAGRIPSRWSAQAYRLLKASPADTPPQPRLNPIRPLAADYLAKLYHAAD